MPYFRQLKALVWRDLILIWNRKSAFSTAFRAYYFPIIFSFVLSIVLRVLWPRVQYGIGNPREIISLEQAMDMAAPDRKLLVFMNPFEQGGMIDDVVQSIARPLRESGKEVLILNSSEELFETCRSNLRGVTPCVAGIAFDSSPEEGDAKIWSYNLRLDGSLGLNMHVNKQDNLQETIAIPVQRAVDSAIALRMNRPLPDTVQQFPYTAKTQEEYKEGVKKELQKGITNFLAIVWYLVLIGLCYHMVGIIAKEREIGMSQLLESMMPNKSRWQTLVLRMSSHYIAFTISYAPVFVATALIAKFGLFTHTNVGYMLLTFVLAGLSLMSWSLMTASLFSNASMSGIVVSIISVGIGVAAQVTSKNIGNIGVILLSLFFNPATFVYNLIFFSRWERDGLTTQIATSRGDWDVKGYLFWIFFLIQIIAYPLIGALIERVLYGSGMALKGRKVKWADKDSEKHDDPSMETTVALNGFGKTYKSRSKGRVEAVKGLSFSALRGQIVALLGANGCGKSTTLNSIAGLIAPSDGTIEIDGTGGIGICPQKNVLWDNITVRQHARIFINIKSAVALSKAECNEYAERLINSCGLKKKADSMASTLSGGQKRKLQLICMLAGGSRVCCVDEVSGGLDPISRQYIWKILMKEKGSRTMIITTHFLDEAEVLADNVIVMSKGKKKASGSVSQLKEQCGGGYRVTYPSTREGDVNFRGSSGTDLSSSGYNDSSPKLSSMLRKRRDDYLSEKRFENVHDAVSELLQHGARRDVQISGPTIEEVFMSLVADDDSSNASLPIDKPNRESQVYSPTESTTNLEPTGSSLSPYDGKHVSSLTLSWLLFRKRILITRRSWLPYVAAILFPIIATSFIVLLLRNFHNPSCDLFQELSPSDVERISSSQVPHVVAGPPNSISSQAIAILNQAQPMEVFGSEFDLKEAVKYVPALSEILTVVDSRGEFSDYIAQNQGVILPGGFFIDGNSTVFTWQADIGQTSVVSPIFMQNIVNILLTGVPIRTQYAPFEYPWPPDTAMSLQFLFYFGLVMAVFPAFFSLYPNYERTNKVRELQYSNGVRPLPLWTAYMVFDWITIVLVSVILAAILATTSGDAFWKIGYFCVVLFLYGLAAVLFGYNISLLAKSQLSSFAFTAGVQAILLMVYLVVYMEIATQGAPNSADTSLVIFHFTYGIISPIAQLLRSMIVGLNLFSAACQGTPAEKPSYAGNILAYGGSILYLVVQCFILFAILVFAESKTSISFRFLMWPFHKRRPSKKRASKQEAEIGTIEPEVLEETKRVENSTTDGLRALHLNKTFTPNPLTQPLLGFGKRDQTVTAVDDVSFGVRKGEVFGLLGPNGAGKTTTISMIRGDERPTHEDGADVFVRGYSVGSSLLKARENLGVCPQFDASDHLTVDQQLAFYAQVRGVEDVKGVVDFIVENVGLEDFRSRVSTALSGGNKRKLSLGIALLGNPKVMILDEPSSGMDPLTKRFMWAILLWVSRGRSIVLTTHSMEEADALANRIGVMARKMLDIGTVDHLRDKYSRGFRVHIVLATEQKATQYHVDQVSSWFKQVFPGSELEGKCYHGQMRWHVPVEAAEQAQVDAHRFINPDAEYSIEKQMETPPIAKIFVALEREKESLGIRFYSVSPTSLDEVFLQVVKRKGVSDEAEEDDEDDDAPLE